MRPEMTPAISPTPAIDAQGGLWGARALRFDALPSTNAWSLAQSSGTLAHGDVVMTAHQTAGRGRLGREWVTPADAALTFSVILDPPPAAGWRITLLGAVAALAVRDTLRQRSLPARVKWPNDVWLGPRKVAGILAERMGVSGPVVLGIGLNVNLDQADFDRMALRQPATSLRMETGAPVPLAPLWEALRGQLEQTLPLAAAPAQSAWIERWNQADALAGQYIRLTGPDGPLAGAYRGLDPHGALRLRDPAGRLHTLLSGEVEQVRPA